MPRFVVLYHECPPDYIKPNHWDFMLEFDGVLWTWELRSLPAAWGGNAPNDAPIPAIRLADHRREFLDFEGPLTGRRGTVARVMNGDFESLENTADRLRVRLESSVFRGEVRLTFTNGPNRWQFQASS